MTTEKYEKMASVAQIYKKHCKDLCYSPEKTGKTPQKKNVTKTPRMKKKFLHLAD